MDMDTHCLIVYIYIFLTGIFKLCFWMSAIYHIKQTILEFSRGVMGKMCIHLYH